MKLITKRDLIKQAIKDFTDVWGDKSYTFDKRGIMVGAELKKLDAETVTVEEVEALIGSNGWTRRSCDECERDVDVVVEVGDHPKYDNSVARMCIDCLNKATNLYHLSNDVAGG